MSHCVLTGLTRLSADPNPVNPVYKPSALLRRGEEFYGVANLVPLERREKGRGKAVEREEKGLIVWIDPDYPNSP